MNNKGFEMSIKNNAQKYIALYPHTIKSQVLGWNIGEVSNMYIVELKAKNWINNKQVVQFKGISKEERPYCLNILSGSKEQMIEQENNFYLIKSIKTGINQIEFECVKPLSTDIQVQIWWTK